MKTSLRILNLEDNKDDAELNQAMISARWPHSELVRVDSRADFLEQLEKGKFDLIFSDYTMPGFEGKSALVIAREKCPGIAIVCSPICLPSGSFPPD